MNSEPASADTHPSIAALLRVHTPVATHRFAWGNGTIPLQAAAFTTNAELPLDLVSSVRCIVQVGDRVVYCENRDGSHPMPGGRRIDGESFADTAAREVHEETGWRIDRDSLRPLGWLRLTHLGPRPEGNPGPYPDFLQVVFTATATERDGGADVQWTDTDGYELTSRLVTVAEARGLTSLDLLAPTFLDLLR